MQAIVKIKDFNRLLIVIFIGLSTIVSGCVINQDITQNPSETPIQTQTSISPTPQASIIASQSEGRLKLNHRGGDDLTLSDVKIIIKQGDANAIYAMAGQSSDKFVNGDTLYITPTSISLNGRILTTGKISIENSVSASGATVITLIYLPNGKELAKISISGAFFSSTSTTPQSSIVISKVGSGSATLAHRGGDSITLSDIKIIMERGGSSAVYEPASQGNDKFTVGDTLEITPTGISLNGRALNTKVSIEGSGIASGGKVTITIIYLLNGREIAKITASG